MRSITDLPAPAAMARFPADFAPRFLLTVDTEEEFDWHAPFRRGGHGLDHVPHLRKFQHFCDRHGVAPVYLIDHPIATSPAAIEILREAALDGRAEIGVQLHPWVNPPFTEELCDFNSFSGNLPADLEHEKFRVLHDCIAAATGVKPLIYRAGRYGLGPHTAAILRGAGIAVDSSVRARFDYTGAGGVNYRYHPAHPYWADDERTLLELPLTTVFSGGWRRMGDRLYPALWRVPMLRGILARSGLLERIPLTPEGITVAEAKRGIDAALAEGLPLLVFSFHSPSLHPGNTPYVRHEEDLARFYNWWRDIFAYLTQRGVQPTSVAEITTAVQR